MRLSNLFCRTLREIPSGAETIGKQLLLRAGMIRRLVTGSYVCLPLGLRVLGKVKEIMREELEAIGGQEFSMPIAPEMTAERAVTELVRREVNSYRQLPFIIYQFPSHFSKEAYSFHADLDSLEEYYSLVYKAYRNIFNRCGVEALAVEADPPLGLSSQEFLVLSSYGEEAIILCSSCDYAATLEGAEFFKVPNEKLSPSPIEKVATPGCKTIQAVASYLNVETNQTLKAVFYVADSDFIFVVIRGDLDVNENKLSKAIGEGRLRIATEEEIKAVGAEPGYASPIGLTGVKVVADDSILLGSNFVAGANEEGYHFINVNYPRDFRVDILTDIAIAREGELCARCGGNLTEASGIKIARLSRLGSAFSEELGAAFLDRGGKSRPIVMGAYAMDISALMGAIVEQNHDEKGIVWPLNISPYQIYLISLGVEEEVVKKVEEVYIELKARGYEVLYDDRDERAGVKFNDADLIGLPLRLVISPRTLEKGGVEVKLRREEKREVIGFSELPLFLQRFYDKMGVS